MVSVLLKRTKAWTSDDWLYECPHCGQFIEDRCEEKEHQVKCPACKEIFIVEEPGQEEGVVMEEYLTTRIEERRWDVDDYYLIVKVQVLSDIFSKGDEVEVIIRKVDIPIGEMKECCQKEKEQDQFSATCPECKTRLPRPDGIKCWLNEDQRDRPWPPGAPAIGDKYIPYLTEDGEKGVE